MTGILIPEMVIYQTLENITEYIRQDLKNHSADDEGTFLYRLLGLDDDGNPMKMNRYNYFIQAKKIFSNPKNLDVNFGYNFEVAKIISFHIILPSEQPSSTAIGEDEGYLTEEEDESGKIQMKYCQMFSSNYQIMITSDNMSEVNLVYHIYKSLLVTLVPHLSLKGLLNPKFSGNDIVFQDDTMPMGIFHKVINLHFDYELVVPQLLLKDVVNALNFQGSPVIDKEDSAEAYPEHQVSAGKSVYNDMTEGQLKHFVQPAKPVFKDYADDVPKHIIYQTCKVNDKSSYIVVIPFETQWIDVNMSTTYTIQSNVSWNIE